MLRAVEKIYIVNAKRSFPVSFHYKYSYPSSVYSRTQKLSISLIVICNLEIR